MKNIDNKADNVGEMAVPAFATSWLNDFPGPATQALAYADATRFTARHKLPGSTVLARLLAGMYRNPPDGRGPEVRDDRPVDEEILAECKLLFDEARSKLDRMRSLLHWKVRLAIPHILATDDPKMVLHINSAVVDILSFGSTREALLSVDLVFMREWVDNFGRYVLFVTDAGPRFRSENSEQTLHRQMVTEFLQVAGWSFPDNEIDLACAAVELNLGGKKSGSSGLRISRLERAEAKAWRDGQGLIKADPGQLLN